MQRRALDQAQAMKTSRKKQRHFYWYPVIGAVVMVIAFATMGRIWMNVRDLERIRFREHENLAEHMAQTAKFFISEGQYDYFYRVIRLLTQVSFIDYLAVYQNGRRILQSGNRTYLENDQDPAAPQAPISKYDASRHTLFISRALVEDGTGSSILQAAFSLQELQGPKKEILGAFSLIAGLLIFLGYLGARLYFTHRQLRISEKTKADMIYSITHDARQDLTVIQGKLQSLLKKQNRHQPLHSLEKDLKSALESSDSIVRFLNNLSDQQRLGKGEIEIIPGPVDMVHVIREIMLSFKEKMAKRRMDFIFQEPAERLWVRADVQVVKRVLMNLIHNAIKYSQPDTFITLGAEQGPACVRVNIADQGIGIAPEHWNDIFQPYYQLNPNSPGMGLGLHTSQQLIRLSGGEMGIASSRPGAGTQFYFTLPNANQPEEVLRP